MSPERKLPFTRVGAIVFLLGPIYHASECPLGPVGGPDTRDAFLALAQEAMATLGCTHDEMRAAVEAAPFLIKDSG